MKNQKDTLGDRMKEYEYVNRNYLTNRLPIAIRCDGKAFHSLTKGFNKPFDKIFMQTMVETAKYLCENITYCKVAYVQSDEISLLLNNYENIESEPWFNNNIQKIVSVSASMATLAFNKTFRELANNEVYYKKLDKALFDSRVFVLPKEEVCNYFIWRQQDATRNSINMVAQANFSHKSLQGLNCNQMQDKLWEEKQINWNDFETPCKRGTCIIRESYMKEEVERHRWVEDRNIPIFTQDREYINKFI